MTEIGTKENPYKLETESLPTAVVEQELEIVISQIRANISDPRVGIGKVEIKCGGDRKYLSIDEYEYVLKTLDWAKDYIKRHFTK